MKSKVAHCFLFENTQKPYNGSSSRINAYIEQILDELDYNVFSFYKPGREYEKMFAPFVSAEQLNKTTSTPKPQIVLYCDKGLNIKIPSKTDGCKNILYFHGLLFNSNIWINHENIDIYCANSQYTRNVISSIVAYAHLDNSINRVLFNKVIDIPPPLHLLDESAGHDSTGALLQNQVKKVLKSKDIFGHCLQGGKADPKGVYWIIYYLNKYALEHHDKRKYRLFVSMSDYEQIKKVHNNAGKKYPIEVYYIPVPWIKNKEVVELMKSCMFCLCYNYVVESFGIYPLESIFTCCPVYTNGIGNLRHLLPRNHGIYCYENEKMAFGKVSEYSKVAELIYKNILDYGSVISDCQKGVEYIKQHYSIGVFKRRFIDMLENLNKTNFPAQNNCKYKNMKFEISPLVRIWNKQACTIVSDIGNYKLTKRGNEIMMNYIGKKMSDIRLANNNIKSDIKYLLRNGLIALMPIGN